MEKYTVKKVYGKKGDVTARVPGSKSITNRALLIAALAEGESFLEGALFSDDSEAFCKCIEALGIKTEINKADRTIKIKGSGGKLPVKSASLNVGSAGTAARFLTALLGMSEGRFFLTSSEQMKKRPMKPLLDSLSQMGAKVIFHEKEGFFPFTIEGKTFEEGSIEINIDESSQFLSAFLICSCLCKNGVNIKIKGSHGMNYIKITTDMMREFGINAERLSADLFSVKPNQKYVGRNYKIEADASAACYFYAAAAILGIRVTVENIFSSSMQGDIGFVDILRKMGCKTEETQRGLSVTGPEKGKLRGISVDMHDISDQALTLAAIAPFADSPVTICGISHIRGQECDRIEAIIENLRAMGIDVDENNDILTIYPGTPKPAEIETYEDHRVAMSFSVTGLRADGIVIKNPLCCKKTFANFFEELDLFVGKFS